MFDDTGVSIYPPDALSTGEQFVSGFAPAHGVGDLGYSLAYCLLLV